MTGAGEAFNGALALADGRDLVSGTMFANAARALSMTKIGTALAMPSRAVVDSFLSKHHQELRLGDRKHEERQDSQQKAQ